MDKERAGELYPQVSQRLKELLRCEKYSEIYINMGKAYLIATGQIDKIVTTGALINYAKGGIGGKAKSMKEWIYGNQPRQ